MKLSSGKSKNKIYYYISKSFRENGKSTTKIIEKLGTLEDLIKLSKGKDPIEWGKEYAKKLTEEEKKENQIISIKFNPLKQIESNETVVFNGGYLFLEKIYNQLSLKKICNDIVKKYKIKFNLNDVISKLVYARIIYPNSKYSTYKIINKFIEQSKTELQHIYRGLEYIAKENYFIQSETYKNSNNIIKRDRNILYYDCTNFYFEIDYDDELRKYGVSKEHRPNPIVQMGLFIDSNGLPLAFSINPGNTNEQTTLKPLEKQILKEYNLSNVIICTDAGLSSYENKMFNNFNNKHFVSTQSIKKLPKFLQEFCLNKNGWHLIGSNKEYNIDEIDEEKYHDAIFYKNRWINEKNLEQNLIVTFSIKYKTYIENIRERNIQLANNSIEKNSYNKINSNNYKKYIKKISYTNDGEIAKNETLYIDKEKINQEKEYDGYYAVCTNLDISPLKIIEINKNRWEIEESFRIMKSEFKARPVYLSRHDRITAHFITCYLSLLIYRLLEIKLNKKWSCNEIIETLRNMNFHKIRGEGYIPLYEKNEITDALHKTFNLQTDLQFITNKKLKEILKEINK